MLLNYSDMKKAFLYILVGSLVVAALVAVVSILAGEFSEVMGRTMLTLFIMIIHSFLCLAFLWDDERQGNFHRFGIFSNTLLVLIILSFFVSCFAVWDVMQGETAWNFYQAFFVLAFAALHADVLSKALNIKKYLDTIILINYIFMAVVVLMIMPWIFIDNALRTLGEFYFRLLGAAGIVDGTLSILTIIFYKIHIHNNPRAANPLGTGEKKSKSLSIWVWILILYLLFQFGLPLLVLFFWGISSLF